jgi:periplasmic divalent cation tolerance protein
LDPNDKPVLIYATFPNPETAQAAARSLVEAGLAACVNILPGMVSIYLWQGAVERADECVVLIKTRQSLAEAAIADASRRHPYDTPAFVVLPITGGSARYLDWIANNTASG